LDATTSGQQLVVDAGEHEIRVIVPPRQQNIVPACAVQSAKSKDEMIEYVYAKGLRLLRDLEMLGVDT
jgi:hypothetical protein